MNGHKKRMNLTASGMAAMLSCLLFFSCNDEDFLAGNGNTTGNACDNICFGISPDGNVQTRGNAASGEDGYTSGLFVLRSRDSADTLCVRATVSDSIHSPVFGEKKAVTRGTPVTEDNFYDSFHVLAYWKKNDVLVEEQFYMDADVTKKENNLWSSTDTYYWPGAGHTLQFYAWAPVSGAFKETPTTPESTVLTYTVPSDAADQKDIVVASPEETPGDHNAAQSLTFNHICTAVRFVTGSQMQPGTIKSVALKGVRHKGSYDLTNGKWTLNDDVTDFTQSLDKEMSGSETDGTEVATGEATFMMLPQTLPTGAKVEVVFADGVTGENRTLEAPVAEMEWPQGKTVTYKLSISPEYNMSIECDDKVDAHYVIQKIEVKVDCDWTLSSDVDWLTFTDWSYDTGKPENRPLGLNGYWIRSERGNKTFSGSGNKTLYAYYDENLSKENREATMTLTYRGRSGGNESKVVTQYCPAWNGDAGYERFEEDENLYPFGYAWDRKVTFTAEPEFNILQAGSIGEAIAGLFGAYVFRYIANNAIEQYDAAEYVTVEVEERRILFVFTVITKTTVTIDYSNFNAIGSSNISTIDGLANTRYLYDFENIGQISTIENRLRDNAVGEFSEVVNEDSHKDIPIDQFAVRKIAMKNEFQKIIRESEEEGQTIKYIEAYLKADDIHWYLPAVYEQASLKEGLVEGTDEMLNGTYWSSTAVSDNEHAYTYDANGNETQENRMATHKIRAAVKTIN